MNIHSSTRSDLFCQAMIIDAVIQAITIAGEIYFLPDWLRFTIMPARFDFCGTEESSTGSNSPAISTRNYATD